MKRDIPTLDGWRAIAISLVLFSHGYPSLERIGAPPIESRERLGILGVQIFFALSGFLITSKLLSEEKRSGQASLSQFYLRRVFRILPVATLFIAAIWILSSSGQIPPISSGRFFSCLLIFANYSSAEPSYYLTHYWSLAVEEHFYLVWPILFVSIRGTTRRLILTGTLVIIVALWRAVDWKYQLTGDPADKFFGRSDIMADAILCGVVLAIAAFQNPLKGWLEAALAIRPLWMLIVVCSFALGTFHSHDWKLNFAALSVEHLALALMIYGAIVNRGSWLSRILEFGLLKKVGVISYSLYLWQQLFLVIPTGAMASGALSLLQMFPINLVTAFVMATASYHLIEKRAIGAGRRLIALQRNELEDFPKSDEPKPQAAGAGDFRP